MLLPTLAAALALGVGSASGESYLRLARPPALGKASAAVYSLEGERVGSAALGASEADDGTVEIFVDIGLPEGARTTSRATLEPTPDGLGLRPRHERTLSVDGAGRSVLDVVIDHPAGHATCSRDGEPPQEVALPEGERVANVPVHLALLPLLHGEAERVDLQFILCRDRPRVVATRATLHRWLAVEAHDGAPARPRVAQIRYRIELGMLTGLAGMLLPRISFWLDPDDPTLWLGNTTPVQRDDVVLLLLEGLRFEELVDGS